MTIAAGFVARDGILICTDSQHTAGEKTYRSKIIAEICGSYKVAFTFCGEEDYAKSAVEDAFERVRGLPEGKSIQQARKSIREAIRTMAMEYKEEKYPNQEQGPPQFLVAISTRSERMLYLSRDAAMPPIPSYACLGSGGYLANYMIPLLLPVPPEFMTIRSLVPIAIQAMAAVKRHDSYCGGGSNFIAIRGTESRTYNFSEAASTDAVFAQYERLASLLLNPISNPDLPTSDFGDKLTKFAEEVKSLRACLVDPPTSYLRLLNHLSPQDSEN